MLRLLFQYDKAVQDQLGACGGLDVIVGALRAHSQPLFDVVSGAIFRAAVTFLLALPWC